MKRIVIITRGFTGSTLPLAKEFLKRGYAVDYYLMTYTDIKELEALECCFSPRKYGLSMIPKEEWESLGVFLDSVFFRLYCIKLPRPYTSIPCLRNIVEWYSRFYIKDVCRAINSKPYELLYISCGYYSGEYVPFLRRFESDKLVVGLHEVCNHFNPNFNKPSKLLRFLFKNDIRIVVYSEKSKEDILRYKQIQENNVTTIHFGLFTSYKTIKGVNMNNLPKDYILFLGVFRPYKGLSVLYEAVNHIKTDLKCVVAGSGVDPAVDEMKKSNKFVIINHFLTNEELITLIQRSKFVVCPYLTASQSGIPQTSFVFNKPIVASDIDGINNVVFDGENGLLFKCGDSEGLAKCILRLNHDNYLLLQLSHGASEFPVSHPEYSWQHIASEFLDIF